MEDAHLTELPFILAHIDGYEDGIVRGWAIDLELKKPVPFNRLRFLQNEKRIPRYIYGLPRNEISDLYRNEGYLGCGFELYPETSDPIYLQSLNGDEWKTLRVIEISSLFLAQESPNLITLDNFYLSPDKVRNFALNQSFISNGERKGFRSTLSFNSGEIKRRFEDLLNLQIERWDYPNNGAFYYYTQNDNLIIDSNGYDFIALVFLNPKSPKEVGIDFYQRKEVPVDEYDEFSNLEKLDFIGVRYNRMVLFKHDLINTVSEYFGDDKRNSFLFQFFVFSVKN